MFGKAKTTTTTKTRTGNNGSDIFSANTIQNGTVIEGKVNSEGSIRIDGKLNGSISTKAKLVIGKTGVIIGDIFCQDASIEGKVEGKITVKGLLDVKGTGIIEGEFVYNKIVVEEGAKLLGKLSMSNNSNTGGKTFKK